MRGDRPTIVPTGYLGSGFTPHARGSTSATTTTCIASQVYPACAGIDPVAVQYMAQVVGLPRMRGDRPQQRLLPCALALFTPHARGSTPLKFQESQPGKVYPACAGIDLGSPTTSYFSSRLPRMRGDRPHMHSLSLKTARFTPHARGSTETRGIK